jgi:O-antigen/teichoic acid export membrane protein
MDTSTSSTTNPTNTVETGTPGTKRGRIAVNFSWLMAGEVAAKGLAFVSTVYLARVLGKGNFGVFSFATAFLAYGMLLTDFGLSTYGTRAIASSESKPEVCIQNVQSTRLVLAAFLFAVGSMLSFFIIHDHNTRLLFIFSFVGLIPYALGLDWAFRGMELMGFSALWNVLQQAVFVVLVLAIVRGSGQLVAVPLCKAAGCLVASLYLIWILRKRMADVDFSFSLRLPSRATIARMLKLGIPLAASYLMVQVYWNIDTIILGVMDKPEAVGVYSAAYRVVMVATGVCYTITNAFYPGLSYYYRHDVVAYRQKLIKMLTVVITLGIGASVLIFILRNMIISRIYGNGYEGSVIALAILSVAVAGDYIVSAFGTAFISAGFEKVALAAVVFGAVSNIGFNILLIPRYSYVGAGIATVLSYVLMAVFYLANLRKILSRRHNQVEQE